MCPQKTSAGHVSSLIKKETQNAAQNRESRGCWLSPSHSVWVLGSEGAWTRNIRKWWCHLHDMQRVRIPLIMGRNPSSVPVYLGSPSWCARALSRSKIDGFVPQAPHVNMSLVGHPVPGSARMCTAIRVRPKVVLVPWLASSHQNSSRPRQRTLDRWGCLAWNDQLLLPRSPGGAETFHSGVLHR